MQVIHTLIVCRPDSGFPPITPLLQTDQACMCWPTTRRLLLPEKVGLEPLKAAFGTLMEGIASGYEDVKTPDLPW